MPNFSLDNLNKKAVNRFAAVIVAAKQARRINQNFLAERENEIEKEGVKEPKAAVEALESLSKGEIEFQYPEIKNRKRSR